jgi:hypothetical protein
MGNFNEKNNHTNRKLSDKVDKIPMSYLQTVPDHGIDFNRFKQNPLYSIKNKISDFYIFRFPTSNSHNFEIPHERLFFWINITYIEKTMLQSWLF